MPEDAVRHARELDRTDPLARFRAEFFLPPGQLYFDGNSLGLLSRRAETALQRAVESWRHSGIDGWLEQPTGAAPESICVGGQTTPNLHQLLATLFDPAHPTRRVILGDALNFASDSYALQSHLRLRGLDPARHLRLVTSRDGRTLHPDDLAAALAAPDVQLAVLPAVLFTSGQLLSMATLASQAQAHGVRIGFDCSHSIGAVPHALEAEGADFAFWCHYKWLNAGPGAVGGLYLHPRHFGRDPGLAGWWGVRADRRFAMAATHEPAAGAAALQIGTPHILSLAPLQGSLALIAEAGGITALRTKSLAMTDFLREQIEARLAPLGCGLATPRAAAERGGHLALTHPEAWRLCRALKAAGVVPDFRGPDMIRLAPSPLYNTFGECAEAVARLEHILTMQEHLKFGDDRALVT